MVHAIKGAIDSVASQDNSEVVFQREWPTPDVGCTNVSVNLVTRIRAVLFGEFVFAERLYKMHIIVFCFFLFGLHAFEIYRVTPFYERQIIFHLCYIHILSRRLGGGFVNGHRSNK